MDGKTQAYILKNLDQNVEDLALRKAEPGVDMHWALRQIEARQKLAKKVPEWAGRDDLLFPVRLSLEQASSEKTACYKASLAEGLALADLSGGMGIDTYYLSSKFQKVDYVEHDEELCRLAEHNFSALGVPHIQVHHREAEDFIRENREYDWVYVDPARRNLQGKKMVGIRDCSPDMTRIQDEILSKASHCMVKLSPMLDIHSALEVLKNVCEVHVLAVDNECKELLFLLSRGKTRTEPLISCVNFTSAATPQILSFTRTEERNCGCVYAEEVEEYLYEPNAAIMKAGMFKLLTRCYPIKKLHPQSHLYTSSILLPDFEGRIFRVLQYGDFNKRIKKEILGERTRLNVVTRNFPLDTGQLRTRLKIQEGGTDFFFATTIQQSRKIGVLCQRIPTV